MAKLVPFSLHEAVLLLEAHMETQNTEQPRLRVVKRLSEDLRRMAINSGIEIDDIYRNVNGISFQLASMESAYVGRTISKPATRLFLEIVSLYRENRGEYVRILEEARSMVDGENTIKGLFTAWLARNAPADRVSELYLCYPIIEKYCLTNKILKEPLFETSDLETVKNVHKTIMESHLFQLVHNKQMKIIELALQYYTAFIKGYIAEESKPAKASSTVKALVAVAPSVPKSRGQTAVNQIGKKEIVKALKNILQNESAGNKFGTTLQFLCDALARNISLNGISITQEDVRQLLQDAPWAEFRFNRYYFADVSKPSQSTTEPKTLTIEKKRTKADTIIPEKCETPLIRTAIDKTLQQRYPLMFKRVYMSLRDAKGKAKTAIGIYEEVGRRFRQEDISNILNQASWSKPAANGGFLYSAAVYTHSAYLQPVKKSASTAAEPRGNRASVITPAPVRPRPNYDTAPFERVLEERFVKGFRLGSTLDMKKFKRYYEELNEAPVEKKDDVIEEIIRSYGIVYEDMVFLPKTMLSEDVKERLYAYIDDAFSAGKTSIYFEALFREFSEDFLDHYIYNADMLRSYLAFECGDKYVIGRNQLFKEAGVTTDPIDEVRTCLKEHGGPMETDRLCAVLAHLPRDNVIAILGSNLEFVRNSKGEYFHADVLALSKKELENIAELIEDAVRSHTFMSGTELMNAIRAKYPRTYEGYSSYSTIGWRDALKYKFGDRFSFRGNIISRSGATLSMRDVFGQLAAEAETITVDELLAFAKEMGTVIYFDAVYENALRINEDTFVSKAQAAFREKETDGILDRFCTGNYIPLADIREFGIFPDAGFPWTVYLLESYAAFYSERYTLLHGGYNQNCAVGAIVKKSAGYSSFDDLIVDVIADSGIPLKKANALDFLVKSGYIARRIYAGIEELLIRANAQRNRKGRP